MLTEWLTYKQRPVGKYKFAVVDVLETSNTSEEVLNYLAGNLLSAHVNLEMLIEDINDIGLNELAVHLQRFLPQRVITKVGNFGEVLAANLLIQFEGFWLPIYKLRFRDKRDWAIRLTDLCLIKNPGDGLPMVCYGEVKTVSSGKKTNIAVAGHESLAKDDALSDPEVLRFFNGLLYELGRHEERKFIRDIWLNRLRYTHRHDLFIVYEKDHWEDAVLDELEAIELNSKLVDFSIKVVLLSKLRELIDESYRRCEGSLKASM